MNTEDKKGKIKREDVQPSAYFPGDYRPAGPTPLAKKVMENEIRRSQRGKNKRKIKGKDLTESV